MDLSRLSIFVIPFAIFTIVQSLLLYVRMKGGVKVELVAGATCIAIASSIVFYSNPLPSFSSASNALYMVNLVIVHSLLVLIFVGINQLLTKLKRPVFLPVLIFVVATITVPIYWITSLYVSCYTGLDCI